MIRRALLATFAFMFAAQAYAAPRYIFGPYKHMVHAAPYLVDGKRAHGPGTLTWAFATGECGEEKWGELSAQQLAAGNVAAFNQAGVDYIVSTGGQGGVFTCATDAGMARFIAHYDSPRLAGLDFDIEAEQTAAQVDSLIARIKAAQAARPQLRFSFTVATHAASDGSRKSLNAQGEAILAALRRHGMREFTLNLMVMDYGPGDRSVCVLNRKRRCDMGKSALQAARNVSEKYALPLSQIALTAMIGVNDVVSNVFTLDDARLLARASRQMGLAGLHYWSFDRDQPCSAPVSGASATCSGMPYRSGDYHRVLGGG